jgi:hypothetical protein
MRIVGVLVGIAIVVFGYFWVALNWNYSTGERAGWIQKFSKKGWFCKTWEGETAEPLEPVPTPEGAALLAQNVYALTKTKAKRSACGIRRSWP